MAFSVDHTKAFKGRFIPPEGAYEVVIESAGESQTRNGAHFLDLKLVIRQDVNQDCRGETIHHAIWRKKTPGKLDPEGYPNGVIQSLSECAGMENGMSFRSLDDWLTQLPGRSICVTIRHEEYNGSLQARVAYVNPPGIPFEKGSIIADPNDLPF
jgi:hypothetical protein